MNVLSLMNKSKDIHNYKVQTLQKIKKICLESSCAQYCWRKCGNKILELVTESRISLELLKSTVVIHTIAS